LKLSHPDFEELDVNSSPFQMFIGSNVGVSLGNLIENEIGKKESFSLKVLG